jgi:hypothetical protein
MEKIKHANRYQLAGQLDTLVANVAKRGIYVIDRKHHAINIIDYVTKSVKLRDIPNLELAHSLCNRINKQSKLGQFNFTRTQLSLDYYNRLIADTVFYRHTVKTTKDSFRKQVAMARLDVTISKLKEIVAQIARNF